MRLLPARISRDIFIPVLALLAVLAGWLLVAGDHYLLFHSLAELFTAGVALVIFSVAWHTRRVASSDYVTFIGMAAFPIAWVTMLHALTYKGIQVLPEYDANLPTQLWVIARILQVSAFLIAPLYFSRKLERPGVVLALYSGVAAALVVAALTRVFPAAFVEGQGLTPFKVWAEYSIIAGTFLAAMAISLYRKRLEPIVYSLLIASMFAMVVAEFAFTQYSDPTGPANRVGHVAYLVAFSLLYVALVRASLEAPYTSLFRELKVREEQLAEAYSVEHDIAETLQNAMAANPKHAPGIDVAHHYMPAPGVGRLGGDFYDVFPLGGTKVGFVIGDVCGKGLRAAGTTLKTRTALRAVALEHDDPAQVLNLVNAYLCTELEEDSFVTAAYGVLETTSGVVRLALAGHPDPMICGREDRSFDLHRTPPLGVLEDLDAESCKVQLLPGESIVLVTDGVVDASGPSGRFGIHRFASLVGDLRCAPSADQVIDEVVEALRQHSDAPVDDDVAVVAIRWTPPAEPAYGT